MNKRTHFGFTLIELMITVAIVAILAAIAYPSYREQVARGKRGDAQATLLSVAQWLERQYTISNAYDKKADTNTIDDTAIQALLQPKAGEAYTLSFGSATAASAPWPAGFSIRMVPKGSMTGDRCGTFVLDNVGRKTDATGTGSSASCWDR